MQSFQERLQDPLPILLDGATGTELNRRGVDTSLPLWSARALIEAPGVLKQIHLDYLKAGAEVLISNTFRTHRRSLAQAGIGERAKELTILAVQIAQEAIQEHRANGGRPAWVAGSIAPLEDCYSPELVPPQEECIKEHTEMAADLAEGGADFLLIETMNTIREAQAAAQAAQDTGLPFSVSFVLRTDGKLFSGESLEEVAKAIEPYDPIMLGINCTPSTTITNSLAQLQKLTRLPTSGYGNIGHTDDIHGWENTDDVTPEEYAELAKEWQSMNLRMLGGCCGTSPAYIEAVRSVLK